MTMDPVTFQLDKQFWMGNGIESFLDIYVF